MRKAQYRRSSFQSAAIKPAIAPNIEASAPSIIA